MCPLAGEWTPMRFTEVENPYVGHLRHMMWNIIDEYQFLFFLALGNVIFDAALAIVLIPIAFYFYYLYFQGID